MLYPSINLNEETQRKHFIILLDKSFITFTIKGAPLLNNIYCSIESFFNGHPCCHHTTLGPECIFLFKGILDFGVP